MPQTVAALAHLLAVGEEHTRTFVDEERAYTACHGADTGDGSYSRFGEHITRGGEDIGAPALVSGSHNTADDSYCPRTVETDRDSSDILDGIDIPFEGMNLIYYL